MKMRATNREREVVLLEGGDADLSLEDIVARCGQRVCELVEEACRWRRNVVGREGRAWKPGDHNILVFETTAAVDAELFVQFWSEPLEPIEWQVCSGQGRPAVKALLGPQAEEELRALGFEPGADPPNYRKTVTIANTGDARAVARETLRVFVEALGYRGRTPLVARIGAGTRARRQWVHGALTPEDVQKMFRRAGCRAVRAEAPEVPVLNVEHHGLKYSAVMYARLADSNLYECVDLRVFLGHAHRSDLPRLNAVNTSYRNIKAWLDEDREAWLVQSIGTRGGLTEAAFRVLVEQFERALHDPAIAQLARSLEREGETAPQDPDAEEAKAAAGQTVH